MIAEHLVSEVRRLQALVNERDLRLKAIDEGREGEMDKLTTLEAKVKRLEEEKCEFETCICLKKAPLSDATPFIR